MGKRGQLAIIDIDFRKIERLQKAMKKAPTLIAEELATAVRDLVLLVEAEAKRLCPVDTGKLRASITPVIESWAAGYVGTNTEYAPYVEYGTRKTDAQPFLEPAFIEGKRQASKIFGEAVSRAIARYERSAS
jgi:HK97 gp10 family phage protein